mgnify:FL=1
MPKFKFKTLLSKIVFCLTQCICIRKKLKKCIEDDEIDNLVPETQHPIFDLEKGEL